MWTKGFYNIIDIEKIKRELPQNTRVELIHIKEDFYRRMKERFEHLDNASKTYLICEKDKGN